VLIKFDLKIEFTKGTAENAEGAEGRARVN
jgi:hypothetical protein